MAKETSKSKNDTKAEADGTREVSVESSTPVVAVEHPGAENTDQKFIDDQNEAYLRYRVTGEQGTYIDSLRDQEPDIAPELGIAPHPELANARAPEGFVLGENLNPESNPVVKPIEQKEEEADVNLVEESQEAGKAQNDDAEATAKQEAEGGPGESIRQKALEEGQFAGRVADESPKASQGNARSKG